MFRYLYRDLDYSHKSDRASSPEDEYSKHLHPFNEIVFFVSGKVDYTVESQTKRLEPGDLIFIKAGKFHFAQVDKGFDYERYVIKFPDAILPPHLAEKAAGLSPFLSGKEFLDSVFRPMDSYLAQTSLSQEDKHSLLVAETTKLLVYLPQNHSKEIPITDSLTSDIIFYVESHLQNKLSLKEISSALHYSQSYLVSVFKKNMHCSLMQYIRSKKCILAYKMIKAGKHPEEAAESLGFGEYSTFYRSYRLVLGFAPSQSGENLEAQNKGR